MSLLCCLCPSWFTIKILLLLNAVLGGTLFIRAWKITEKIRIVDKERDALYHSSTRLDAQRWSFWKTLPFAITIMPIRLVIFMLGLFIPAFFVT